MLEKCLGQAVPVLHRGQPRAGGVEHVPSRDVHLGVVAGRAQAELSVFIEGGSHQIGVRAEELDAVGPALGVVAHPLAGLFGGRYSAFEALPEDGVGLDSRGGYLVFGRFLPLVEHPVEAVPAGRVADGGDAVRHPEFENVLGIGGLVAADMAVHIHETGHQEHPLAIQFVPAGQELRPPLQVDGDAGVAHVRHPFDDVVFHNDIDRADGRRAVAVDERHAPDDELRPRAFALGAGRGLFDLVLLREKEFRGKKEGEDGGEAHLRSGFDRRQMWPKAPVSGHINSASSACRPSSPSSSQSSESSPCRTALAAPVF